MLPHRPGPPEESCWVWPGTLIWGISADADWDLLLGLGDSGQRDFFLQSPEDARGLACAAGAGRRLQIPLPAENIETRHFWWRVSRALVRARIRAHSSVPPGQASRDASFVTLPHGERPKAVQYCSVWYPSSGSHFLI